MLIKIKIRITARKQFSYIFGSIIFLGNVKYLERQIIIDKNSDKLVEEIAPEPYSISILL